MMHGLHQAGKCRDSSPTKQYPRDPDASPDLVQQQVAGNFKYEIAEKEDTEDQSELLARDGQLFVHRQRGEANIVAVDDGDDKQQKYKRKDPKPQFPDSRRLRREGVGHGGPAASQTFLS
jgi:hypothetical protein